MRPRRDPRAERATAAVPGPSRARFDLGLRLGKGRPRRDPRRATAMLAVAGGARLRLDRSHHARDGAAPAAATPRPDAQGTPLTIVVETPAFLVAVVPDAAGGRLSAHDRQTVGAARVLAGRDGAVVVVVPASAESCGPLGADRVLRLPKGGGAVEDPHVLVSILDPVLRALEPRHVLFPESVDGGDRARRLAVASGEALFPNVELVTAASVARAARGRRVEQRRAPPSLMTIASDAVADYAGPPREAREIAAVMPPAAPGAVLAARRVPADPATVPLALADFVASAGNGVSDLDAFRRLVAALRATPGASRVMCDAGLMPRASQVGASGTVLTASCYFALGISGAPQHLQGVAGCAHVVAVNTDLHAAMIERAGLAVVQDAQRVMPALLALLAAEAEGAP